MLRGILGGLTVAAIGIAVAFGLEKKAEGRHVVTPADVLDLRIVEWEKRYDSPYNLMIGSRLAADYSARFGAKADLADVARAEKVTNELIEAWPDRRSLKNSLASLYITQHRFADAYALAEANVAADSTDAGALGVLFDAAMALGRYDVAATSLGALDEDQFGRRIREARWLAAHGHNDEASRLQTAACEELEASAGDHLVVAWCWRRLFDVESGRAAEAALERSEAAWPGFRGVKEARANMAYADGRWAEARALFTDLQSDAHPDIYLRLAEVSDALGMAEEARRWQSEFLRAVSGPEVEPLYAQPLAEYLAASPDTRAEALAVMRRDIERRPSIENYDVLAWVLLQNDRPEETLSAVQQARRFGEPTLGSDYLRARALEALGRTDEASPYRAAAEADPAALPHVLQLEIRAGR
jgi:hypothetical protein